MIKIVRRLEYPVLALRARPLPPRWDKEAARSAATEEKKGWADRIVVSQDVQVRGQCSWLVGSVLEQCISLIVGSWSRRSCR